MKSFGSESGGSWCFPSITMVIILETVVFSMAGNLSQHIMALRGIINYRF